MKLARIAARLRPACRRHTTASGIRAALYWRRRRAAPRPVAALLARARSLAAVAPGAPGIGLRIDVERQRDAIRGAMGQPGARGAPGLQRMVTVQQHAARLIAARSDAAAATLAHAARQPAAGRAMAVVLSPRLPAPAALPLAQRRRAVGATRTVPAWPERVVLHRIRGATGRAPAPAPLSYQRAAMAGAAPARRTPLHALAAGGAPWPATGAVSHAGPPGALLAVPAQWMPGRQRSARDMARLAAPAPLPQGRGTPSPVLVWRPAAALGFAAGAGRQARAEQVQHGQAAHGLQAGPGAPPKEAVARMLAEARETARQEVHSPLNLDRLADELMRRVDKRLRIERERRGR